MQYHREESQHRKHILCPPHFPYILLLQYLGKYGRDFPTTLTSTFAIIFIEFVVLKLKFTTTLLAYVTLNVQSDLILSWFQKHLFQQSSVYSYTDSVLLFADF